VSTYVLTVTDEEWMRGVVARGLAERRLLAVHVVKGEPRPTLQVVSLHDRPAPRDTFEVVK